MNAGERKASRKMWVASAWALALLLAALGCNFGGLGLPVTVTPQRPSPTATLLQPAVTTAAPPIVTPPTFTPLPITLQPPTITPTGGEQRLVQVSVDDMTHSAFRLGYGSQANVRAWAGPVIYTSFQEASYSTSRPWTEGAPTAMQVCFAFDQPCQPGDAWLPFADVTPFQFPVDWLGPRKLWVLLRFRLADGSPVPVMKDFSLPALPELISAVEIWGEINPATPDALQPPPAQTAIAATRAAYPVTGSVVLQHGNCCVGGVVGQEVELQIAYQANSPAGPVTEMRTMSRGGCRDETSMAEAPWRPFVSEEQQKLQISAINWVGFYFSVQYRDSQGNLSPVYCDDISVEGMPAPPNTTP